MKFVQILRHRPQLGHDARLEKLAVPLWPDAGKALGLSRNHTYDAARAGEIPTVKFGRTIRVPLAALRKMLEDAGQKPGPNKK
jgi:excisionase family DNA binding protein